MAARCAPAGRALLSVGAVGARCWGRRPLPLLGGNLVPALRRGNAPPTAPGRGAAAAAAAQPRKKLPTRTVKVLCSACKFCLYKYKKGGKVSLQKCYHERIVEDHTAGDAPGLVCPQCGQVFARFAMIHGKPASKIIGGKAIQK